MSGAGRRKRSKTITSGPASETSLFLRSLQTFRVQFFKGLGHSQWCSGLILLAVLSEPYKMLRIKPRTAKCEAKVLITVVFFWPQETLGLKKLFILYSNGELMVIP